MEEKGEVERPTWKVEIVVKVVSNYARSDALEIAAPLGSSQPLGVPQVGTTLSTHFSVAPWLPADPFDGVSLTQGVKVPSES